MGIEKFFKPIEKKSKSEAVKKTAANRSQAKNEEDEDFQAEQPVQKSRHFSSTDKQNGDKTSIDPKDFFESKPSLTSTAEQRNALKRTTVTNPNTNTASKPSSSKAKASSTGTASLKRKKRSSTIVSDDNNDDDDDYKNDNAESDDEDEFDEGITEDDDEKTSVQKKAKKALSPQPAVHPQKKTKRILPPAKANTATKNSTAEVETEEKEKKPKSAKSNYFKMMNIEPPKALGTRPEPVGAPGCLTGMTFVISGQYETLTKDQTKDIVLRYGGRVTGSVSGKTTYLLKGRDAGLSKTSKAEQCGTKILNEDEFYDLINSFKEKPGVKGEKKNTDDVKKSPNRTSTESNPSGALSDRKSKGKASTIPTSAIHDSTVTAGVKSTDTASAALWTDKYKPKNLNEFIGNKEMVRRISAWLASYEQNRKNDFKARGDEINGFHAILISGPPGIGKTTAAHLIAKLNGYEALEYNASDARSKSILSEGITEMMDNRSITEFFRAPSSSSLASKETNHRDGKIVLIMDEVDGMTAGDRGGSAELARLIKISKIPVICICNDVRSPKVAPLLRVCFDARFKRTPASQIRSRMMTIAHHENMRLEPNAIDQLVELTHNDIRQLINILSMYRIKGSSMSYDQAKKVGSSNQKNSTMNTFQIPTALLPSSAWNSTSLNEKYDVYFHDYALASLMIQENYLKSKPGKAKNDCHAMELIAKAATAVADGDLVDAMIHGTVQHWSLMPVHSIFSCVRPAAYVNGHFSERINFPAWLGQNSKAMKYQRALSDIQTRMRVVSSGDKYEIRQNYVPLLTDKIVHSMEEKKFDETIEIMDTYYLDRDSLDTLNDIAFQRKKTDKQPFAGIPTANKTAFTRMYNSMSHPVLFQAAGIAVQKSVSAPKEDAVGTLVAEDEPLGEEAPLDEESDAEEDPEAEIEKDKFIKGKSKAAAAAKGKKRKATTSSSQSKSRKQAKTKK